MKNMNKTGVSALRPENVAASSLALRTGGFFDLSGFSQHCETQQFSQVEYKVASGTTIEATAVASQTYLNNAQFWFKCTVSAAGNSPVCFVNSLKSVEIRADGTQVLYLDDADILMNIVMQKKSPIVS